MAWRLHDQVIRGEIDNRTRGRVTGRIWLSGRQEPLELHLAGDAWRDLAGSRLLFRNPKPQPGCIEELAGHQAGVTGDMTASRKVRVPEVDVAEMMRLASAGLDYPWHWGNSLYLEWFSNANGRLVIESSGYELTLDGAPAWVMSPSEEEERQKANRRAFADFLRLRSGAGDPDTAELPAAEDDDEPQSVAEAEADVEDARQSLLLDRIERRIEQEGRDGDNFERILEEERVRLRRERGEPEPEPPTPQEEEEQRAWIEEMNAIAKEAAAEFQRTGGPEHFEHPLVVRCRDLALEISRGTDRSEADGTPLHREHPLCEIRDGVMIASGKLAGALNRFADEDDDWPPDPLFAGNTLVRLKKARRHLRDALLGLDAAEEQDLLTLNWRTVTRAEVLILLAGVEDLITELRAVLQDAEEDAEED
jgi:hypothetical protein